nr:hypothetical protein [uncultured Pseudomonas sp.]
MNIVMKYMLAASAVLLSGHVMAASQVYTATVDREGNLIYQDAAWIKGVKLINQKNYFATYEISFRDGQFKKGPVFCSASPTDTGDTDRLLYGQVKMGGVATAEKVNVLAMMPGKREPSGDSSMSFQLMCVR